MAENKKSFIAYVDWKETFDVLPDDKAGKLVKHLFAYVNDENPETDDVLINAVFANIKQTLKRDLRKYEIIREKRAEAGRASGDKRKQKGTKRTSVQSVEQTRTKRTDSVNDNDNVINIQYKPAFDRWLKYKKERRESYKTKDSEIAAYNKLVRLSDNNPSIAEKIVEQSLANNWAGLFELKEPLKPSEVIPQFKIGPSR